MPLFLVFVFFNLRFLVLCTHTTSSWPDGHVDPESLSWSPVSEVTEYVVSEEEAAVKSLHFRAVKEARAEGKVARARSAVTDAHGKRVTRAAGRSAGGAAGLEEA